MYQYRPNCGPAVGATNQIFKFKLGRPTYLPIGKYELPFLFLDYRKFFSIGHQSQKWYIEVNKEENDLLLTIWLFAFCHTIIYLGLGSLQQDKRTKYEKFYLYFDGKKSTSAQGRTWLGCRPGSRKPAALTSGKRKKSNFLFYLVLCW